MQPPEAIVTTWQSVVDQPSEWFHQFDGVIVDEAHGCEAKSLKRIGEALPGSDLAADERLLREIALFADKADITEELVRLESHLVQAAGLLQAGGVTGRALDFLVQEMGREINTIGSKANDGEITRRVVACKTELERFREQVQNIE